jgi:predicted HicB family RNase H-like nuclease
VNELFKLGTMNASASPKRARDAAAGLRWPSRDDLTVDEFAPVADRRAYLCSLGLAIFPLIPRTVQEQVARSPLVAAQPPQHNVRKFREALQRHLQEAKAATHIGGAIANGLKSGDAVPSPKSLLSFCSALFSLNSEFNTGYFFYFLNDDVIGISNDENLYEGRRAYSRILLREKPKLDLLRKQVGYRVHPELVDLFDQAAASAGLSRNTWITKTLISELLRAGFAVPDDLRAEPDAEHEAQVPVSMAAPDDLRERMDAAAERTGLSRNAWIVNALQAALSQPRGGLSPRITRGESFRPMALYLPPALRDGIDKAAEAYGVPRNRWMIAAVEWALDQPEAARSPHIEP